jgi:hypothetical protein
LLNSRGGRQSLLRAGKTTSGLSTISAHNVKDAQVMLPPMAAQVAFVRRVDAIDSIGALQSEAMVKAGATFSALMAKVFSRTEGHAVTQNAEVVAIA